MKLSLNWLNDYVNLKDLSIEELVHRLTLSTCEVEEHTEVFAHLDGVIAAKILEKKTHPNADRLSVCTVDTGVGHLQIVCGAPNAKADTVVPLAPVGVTLPGETPLTIRKSEIRGVESSGMLCSSSELGLIPLEGETEGLLILDPKLKPGKKLSDLYPGIHDIILEIDNKSITHRPDLWCHYGFAREIAAIFKKKLKSDPLAVEFPKPDKGLPKKEIVIEPGAAKAYYGMHCSGVRVTRSPSWMRARLANIGQKPINNIVDASNYVLFDLGQPNHAFDAKSLKSDTITVAGTGKKGHVASFTTLDGVERSIPEGTVMIFDGAPSGASAVAIAGIMGGLHSGIADDTTGLFLESATFPRERIRKALSSLQLRTDSAVRFEKGQDPLKARPALARLCELLSETCPELKGGAVSGESPEREMENRIDVDLSYLRGRLGFDISEKYVIDTLERLHFRVAAKPAGKGAEGDDVRFHITAPTFRSQYDITIPEDIVEELGRVHGYDNIVPVAPKSSIRVLPLHTSKSFKRLLKEHAVLSGGFTETYDYSFASAEDNALFYDEGLRLRNPVQSDADRMRVSSVPGIIRQAALNQDRFDSIRLFELGRIYHKNPKLPAGSLAVEEKRLVFIDVPPASKESDPDGGPIFRAFLDFRGYLERMVRDTVRITPELRAIDPGAEAGSVHSPRFLHPGCAVEFAGGEGIRLGVAGILHPMFEKRFGLKRRALIAEFYCERLHAHFESVRKESCYAPPSVFPDSAFELSLVMDEARSTAEPVAVIRGLAIPEIREIRFITLYRGEQLAAGQKSVSYEVLCGRDDGTLSGERIQQIHSAVIAALSKGGFPLRGGG